MEARVYGVPGSHAVKGEEELQMVPRRLAFSTPIRRRRSDFAGFFEGPLLGIFRGWPSRWPRRC